VDCILCFLCCVGVELPSKSADFTNI
jgi:hypothetical protein